jgi:hypothetical protein
MYYTIRNNSLRVRHKYKNNHLCATTFVKKCSHCNDEGLKEHLLIPKRDDMSMLRMGEKMVRLRGAAACLHLQHKVVAAAGEARASQASSLYSARGRDCGMSGGLGPPLLLETSMHTASLFREVARIESSRLLLATPWAMLPAPQEVDLLSGIDVFEMMNRNARKPKKANRGKRPCSHVRRRAKKTWSGKR